MIYNVLKEMEDRLEINNMVIEIKIKLRNLIDRPKKMIDFINSVLKPKEVEKKTYGEVYTPLPLVEEMVGKLDESYKEKHGKSIFSEPHLKWFDPCVGIGNFMTVVYYKLMIGLKGEIKSKIKRKKHIIENMLYMSEMGRKNVEITRLIFNGENYKLNLFEGDTLELDTKEQWGVEKFDVVLGNPPFQGRGRKKPYIKFINYGIDLLVSEGILLFITPHLSINYLSGCEIVQNKIKKLYDINYINADDNIKKKYFTNIGSDFCYFIIYKNNYKGDTTIIFKNGKKDKIKIDFNTVISLDNNKDTIILKKLLRINCNEWNRKASRINVDLKDEEDAQHKNKIIYKIKTNSVEYKYTHKTHKHFNMYKVLYPTLGNNYIIDYEKKLFPGTSFVVYILCSSIKECENIIKLKDSKIFKYLERIFINQRSPKDYIWRNLIKPYDFDIDINNDVDIYKYFNLTDDEISFIEKNY